MKKHAFLTLNLGLIEEYCMVVKKKDLEDWKSLGWLEYAEIGLPKRVLSEWMSYGEVQEDETLIFNRPTLLKEGGVESLIGRKVTGFSTHLGTYGMGGPGFFGLLLDEVEYLTYAVWGAGNYIFVEDLLVECHPDFYDEVRPWTSNFGEGLSWDELSSEILDSTIAGAILKEDGLLLNLKKKDKMIKMEFVKTDPRIPLWEGKEKPAFKEGDIGDYLVFQHKKAELIV